MAEHTPGPWHIDHMHEDGCPPCDDLAIARAAIAKARGEDLP